MKLKEYLKKLIPTLHGKMIVIGLQDSEINDMILHSEMLEQCYFLDSNIKELKKKNDEEKKTYRLGKNKNIPVRKFRKKFKKKKTDTIICNLKDMECYLNSFVKDSIYICKGKVYYYGPKRKFETTNLKNRYRRYQVSFEEVELKDSHVLVVDLSKAKTRWWKELYYTICDGFYKATDLLGDFLVN